MQPQKFRVYRELKVGKTVRAFVSLCGDLQKHLLGHLTFEPRWLAIQNILIYSGFNWLSLLLSQKRPDQRLILWWRRNMLRHIIRHYFLYWSEKESLIAFITHLVTETPCPVGERLQDRPGKSAFWWMTIDNFTDMLGLQRTCLTFALSCFGAIICRSLSSSGPNEIGHVHGRHSFTSYKSTFTN